MSKDAIISEILHLSSEDQLEVFEILQSALIKDGRLELSNSQMVELDRRLDDFTNHGSRGEPMHQVYSELTKAPHEPHHPH